MQIHVLGNQLIYAEVVLKCLGAYLGLITFLGEI